MQIEWVTGIYQLLTFFVFIGFIGIPIAIIVFFLRRISKIKELEKRIEQLERKLD